MLKVVKCQQLPTGKPVHTSPWILFLRIIEIKVRTVGDS